MNETHRLTLVKEAKRSLNEKVILSNMTTIIQSVYTKSLKVRGWIIEDDPRENGKPYAQRYAPQESDAEYLYEMFLTVRFEREDGKHAASHELATILRTIYARGSAAAFGTWVLSVVDGSDYVPPSDDAGIGMVADLIGYAEVEVPDDWEDNFSHLFGLDPHVARIKTALEAGIQSGWRNRFNCALIGPPGCGKSDICGSVKRALGEDAVMEFDATATTAAGAIKELSEREILPRVLIVEEIEKADEKSLSFLLALCDLRGEIRKTTARATIQRDTKVFVIATVNDEALFNRLNASALQSRFSNKIHFRRPSREMRAMILAREIGKVSGDLAWIEPTLDYCEENHIDDPRQVIAIALCGREMLLTGEFQAMMAATADVADDV